MRKTGLVMLSLWIAVNCTAFGQDDPQAADPKDPQPVNHKAFATIAIGEFLYEAAPQYEGSFGKFVPVLQTQLVNSRKFDVVERDRLDQAFNEQSLSESGLVERQQQQLGKLVGAEFIVYGAISDIQQQALGGLNQITIVVDLNVLQTEEGLVKWAGAVKHRSVGTMDDALRETAVEISKKVMFSIYPITIMDFDGSTVMLNYGKAYIDRDTDFTVYSLGQEMIDPPTGRSLGKQRTRQGTVQITRLFDKYAEARFTPDDPTQSLTNGMICVETDPDEPPPPPPPQQSGKPRRPTAALEITFAGGTSNDFTTNDLRSLEIQLRDFINAGGVFDVVDRNEFSTLVAERAFSQLNSPGRQQQRFGRDASADFIITVSINELRETGVTRGSLRRQYAALVSARVVDTEDGTALANTRADVSDYAGSTSRFLLMIAEPLAAEINQVSKTALTGDQPLVPGSDHAEEAKAIVLRVRPDASLLISDELNTFSVGDVLNIYRLEEFPDPRDSKKMLVDEIRVGQAKVTRKSAAGVVAQSMSPGKDFQTGMVARQVGPSTPQQQTASATSGIGAIPQPDPRSAIPQSGVRPTLHVGDFVYSREFDLSQTLDRSKGSNAGGGSLGVLGAIAGGVIKGGKPEEWIPAAVVGGLAGQVADNERQRAAERKATPENPVNDQSALTKKSDTLRSMIRSKAQASQRFTIIDSRGTGQRKAMMDRERDGDFDTSSLPQRGRLQTAKYTATGTILRYEENRVRKGYSVAGGRETLEMILAMYLEVIDNETGAVIIGQELTGAIESQSSDVGLLGFGTSQENQGAIGELMNVLARNVVAEMVTTLWPILIVSVEPHERTVIINAGETVVRPGDKLEIFQPGEAIVDPYTGATLGSRETTIGELEVFDTQARFSRARILRPIDGIAVLVQNGQVCRPLTRRTAAVQRQSAPTQPQRRGGF